MVCSFCPMDIATIFKVTEEVVSMRVSSNLYSK